MAACHGTRKSAAFAAGGDAHVTGGLAVCAGSCGPGNLHLINGLFDCHRSRLPVVAIAAHIPSPEIGSGYFQETHPEQLFRECSSYCELVSTPEQDAPRARNRRASLDLRALCQRHRHSRRRRAQAGGERVRAVADGLVPAQSIVVPSDQTLDKLADLLNKARRVTLLCGSGCEGAHDELMQLAEALKGADRPRLARQRACGVGKSLRRRNDRPDSASPRGTKPWKPATRF